MNAQEIAAAYGGRLKIDIEVDMVRAWLYVPNKSGTGESLLGEATAPTESVAIAKLDRYLNSYRAMSEIRDLAYRLHTMLTDGSIRTPLPAEEHNNRRELATSIQKAVADLIALAGV